MKALVIALLATAVTAPALAQGAGHAMPMPAPEAERRPEAEAPAPPAPTADPRAGRDMGEMRPAAPTPPEAPPPPAALSGPRHAADLLFDPSAMARAREEVRAEMGEVRAYRIMVDQLEARIRDGEDGYLWDAQGWYGRDINKLWIKTEGEGSFGEKVEEAEAQALWSRAITPWFDFQAGGRYDFRPNPQRAHLVVGLQGLVPYFLEIEAAAFLSNEGDVTARFEAEYDQLITQKLVLQPRVEFDLAAQDVSEIGVGAGLSSLEAGLRLRYEFVPEFAPYAGVAYERAVGNTADFARDEGESVDALFLVAGVRLWF
ncbi:MAG TPA: copper resistance protein B [Opitutaceae bacterium]|nr:copper resistance protein B [Opitutaceae bacterium]